MSMVEAIVIAGAARTPIGAFRGDCFKMSQGNKKAVTFLKKSNQKTFISPGF